MSETFNYAGQAQLSGFVLSSPNGNTYDITDMVVETQICLGLFNNFMSCRLILGDATGIISNLPLKGFESISFAVKNPGFNDKTFTGFVYKISNREELTKRSTLYTIECISYEAVKNSAPFSKSYKGRIDDIVLRIYREYLNTGKFFELEHTSNSTAFISPFWTPVECINWLAARSKSENLSSSSYTFWEDLEGFHFYSMASMFSAQPKLEYNTMPAGVNNGTDQNVKAKLQRMIYWRVPESNSTLDFMLNGTFASKIYVKNINENTFNSVEYDYEKSFDSSKHLNNNSIKVNNDAFGGRNTQPTIIKTVGSYIEAFDNFEDTNAYETWVLQRNSFIDLLNAQRLEIVVPGLFEIRPGNIVNVVIPAPSQHNINDQILSGKYIVINQKHIMTKGKDHTMVLELCKESFI